MESRYRSARRDQASASWWNVSRYEMRSGMAAAIEIAVGVGLAVDGDGEAGEGEKVVDFGAG